MLREGDKANQVVGQSGQSGFHVAYNPGQRSADLDPWTLTPPSIRTPPHAPRPTTQAVRLVRLLHSRHPSGLNPDRRLRSLLLLR